MVQQLLDIPKRRHSPNLILHCGANLADRRAVEKVKTPRATETWNPIPHIQLITQVEHAIKSNHLAVRVRVHWNGGADAGGSEEGVIERLYMSAGA